MTYDESSREVNYNDTSITENTRAAYPIEYINNAKTPCTAGHPDNIIFLTCDASGVLPPVSKLSPTEAMYHFLSGYTARVAGTEVGVRDPQVAFSACFSAAFLMRHPMVYAELLAAKIEKHEATAWLVNTGWSGGAYGTGSRIRLEYTRAIIDAINSKALDAVPTTNECVFGLTVPKHCPGVPDQILLPEQTWPDRDSYLQAAKKLSGLFRENFAKFSEKASKQVLDAGPKM